MRDSPLPEVEKGRMSGQGLPNTCNGIFGVICPETGRTLVVIASDGTGWEKDFPLPVWEHVSVSSQYGNPLWVEMCFVKNLFWGEEEQVVEYHPPKSQYVNCHPQVLHLWKLKGETLPFPPSKTVGELGLKLPGRNRPKAPDIPLG